MGKNFAIDRAIFLTNWVAIEWESIYDLMQLIRNRASSIYYGWWILAAGSAITMVGSVHSSVVSVFFLPLTRELGIGRAALSLLFSLARLEGGIEGPLVGWIIDRRGPRLPIFIGALLGGTGLIALTAVHNELTFVLVYVGWVALGFQMGFLQCMHAVANLWFMKYRTRAMSICSSSVRLGPAIFTPLVAAIAITQGWRAASILSGVVVLIVALPLALLIRRSPESMGLLPDGLVASSAEREESAATHEQLLAQVTSPDGFGFGETLKTPSFWLIAFSTTVRTTMNSAFQVHFIPIFVWKGLTEQGGANMVGLVALTATPLILLVGWLGDRWSKKNILIMGQIAVAMALIILNFANGKSAIYLFTMLFAFGANVSPANYSILGEYYGRRSFARLRGVLNSLGIIGMVATVLAGWVFDTTGSYSMFIVGTGMSAGLAAVMLLLFLRKPERNATGLGISGT